MNTSGKMVATKLSALGPELIVVLWTIIAIALSAERSLWQDELMRYEQMQMGLGAALKSLYAEPSPFAPGEIFLGFVSKFFFSGFTPFELWSRLPAVVFGTLTLVLTLTERSLLYTLMMALSVSVIQFSTQYRPYAAMMFNAALTFKLMFPVLFSKHPPGRVLFYFGIIFGHIYGICFQTMGAVFARRFKDAFFSCGYLLVVLGTYWFVHNGAFSTWATGFGPMDYGVILSWLHITAGGSNHVSDFLLPLATIGFAFMMGRSLKIKHQTLLYLVSSAAYIFAVLICPIIANIVGNYFFAPRQLVGAVFPFITLAWFGIYQLTLLTPKHFKRLAQITTIGIVLIMVRAWGIYVFDGRPPYAEQPQHKHKHRIAHSINQADRTVLLLDPGGTAHFYFKKALGKPITETTKPFAGHNFIVRTWDNYTLYHFDVPEYAWRDLNELAQDSAFVEFANGSNPRFDRILYNAYKLDLKTTIPTARLW